MANYKELQMQFRGLVEKRVAADLAEGKEKFTRRTGVKAKNKKNEQSLISARVDWNNNVKSISEECQTIIKQMTKGKKNAKVDAVLLKKAMLQVIDNRKQEKENILTA